MAPGRPKGPGDDGVMLSDIPLQHSHICASKTQREHGQDTPGVGCDQQDTAVVTTETQMVNTGNSPTLQGCPGPFLPHRAPCRAGPCGAGHAGGKASGHGRLTPTPPTSQVHDHGHVPGILGLSPGPATLAV